MVSVNWPTGVIFVPKSETTLLGTDPVTGREIRGYDSVQFHKDLRALMETDPARTFPNTHTYEETQFAPDLNVNGQYYRVEFEDGTYRVVIQGSNNNIHEVAVINQVSIQPSNSAGLISGGGGLTQEQADTLQLILDILEGDVIPTPNIFRILHKLTKSVLVEKDANVVNNLTQLTEPNP